MKQKTRKQYATINSISSLMIFFLKLFFQFVNRSILISIIGIHMVGVTNLVTSIIGVLGLAELGIGTAITYELYDPIAKGDIGKRNAFLSLYRRIYKYIAGVLLCLGAIVFPFLKFFTSESIFQYEFFSVYVLLLINASVGYWMFAYKRSLLEAQQQKYVFLVWDFIIYATFSILRWGVLYRTQNYTWFLVLNILSTIVSNLVVSFLVDRKHDLKSEISSINEKEKASLKKNVLGGFINQLAGVVVFSTDNLLISKFLGIKEVGLYGNYVLVTSNINVIIQQLTNSHTSSVGNLISTEKGDRVEAVFQKYNFINYAIVYFASLMVYKLITPFIALWLGVDFVLSRQIVFLMSLYLFVNSYRHSFFVFIGGYGLYWTQKKKAIAEAILNMVLSLFFLSVLRIGISGILLGTIASNVLTNLWYEPYTIYRHGLKKPFQRFVKLFAKQVLVYGVSFLVLECLPVPIQGVWSFLLVGGCYGILLCLLFSIFYRKSVEYRYLLSTLGSVLQKVFKQS